MIKTQKIIDEWNRKHPEVGVLVDVTNDFGEVTQRYTESVPWTQESLIMQKPGNLAG